jgi:hypothetical protein
MRPPVLFRAAHRVSSAFPAPEAALGELIEMGRRAELIMFVALNLGGEVCGLAAASPRAASSVLEIYPARCRSPIPAPRHRPDADAQPGIGRAPPRLFTR